ncbi:MAG: amidohydrolase family protein, partial [Ferrovibrio sp.]
KKHPGRFAFLGGGGTLNPMIHIEPDAAKVDDATKQKFAAIANGIIDAGALGFGEMSANHLSVNDAHSYHRSRPDHPLFLLLAEIAAKRNVVIDFHMDAVIEPTALPPKMKELSQRNPPELTPNLTQFETLLAHDRGARIVWAHAGVDHTGVLSVELIRRMMTTHPNLYMSIKALPQSPEPNAALAREGRLRPEWRKLVAEFPTRFVIGTDRFYGSSAIGMKAGGNMNQRASAGSVFLERTVPMTTAARTLLSQLPPQLGQRVAVENVKMIYRLP